MKGLMFTFIVLCVGSGYLFSQDLNRKSINLQANTSVNGNIFFLETLCYEKGINIKIKVKDSISMNTLRLDSTYNRLMNSINKITFDPKNDSLMNLFKKADSAIKVHTVYSIDSVYVAYNQFPQYRKLLNDLFNSSPVKLENNAYNRNRIILDGTQMEFKLLQDDATLFTAYAHSPTKLSHPLLYEFITATLGIYRSERLNAFLTEERTSGY